MLWVTKLKIKNPKSQIRGDGIISVDDSTTFWLIYRYIVTFLATFLVYEVITREKSMLCRQDCPFWR